MARQHSCALQEQPRTGHGNMSLTPSSFRPGPLMCDFHLYKVSWHLNVRSLINSDHSVSLGLCHSFVFKPCPLTLAAEDLNQARGPCMLCPFLHTPTVQPHGTHFLGWWTWNRAGGKTNFVQRIAYRWSPHSHNLEGWAVPGPHGFGVSGNTGLFPEKHPCQRACYLQSSTNPHLGPAPQNTYFRTSIFLSFFLCLLIVLILLVCISTFCDCESVLEKGKRKKNVWVNFHSQALPEYLPSECRKEAWISSIRSAVSTCKVSPK